MRPVLADGAHVSRVIHVSDLDCIVGCRRLVAREGILAGGSAGAVLSAVERMRADIPDKAVCVAILPDSGERYVDTIYSDGWVAEHFGDVAHLWEPNRGAPINDRQSTMRQPVAVTRTAVDPLG